jgi:hypothetical protein
MKTANFPPGGYRIASDLASEPGRGSCQDLLLQPELRVFRRSSRSSSFLEVVNLDRSCPASRFACRIQSRDI